VIAGGLFTVDPQPASATSDDTHIAMVVILKLVFIFSSPEIKRMGS
jgi:hypothetical protein